MKARIILTVLKGDLRENEVVFEERLRCLVGRSPDCNLQLAGTEHLAVSRRHCLLEVDPPDIWVRDLQSTNGTFVNGKQIGRLGEGRGTLIAASAEVLPYRLQDGDRLQVGDIVFLVHTDVSTNRPKHASKVIVDKESREERTEQPFRLSIRLTRELTTA